MPPFDARISDTDYRSLERGIRAIESREQAATPAARDLFGVITGMTGKQRSEQWMSSVSQGLEQLARMLPASTVDGIYQSRVFHTVLGIAAEYAGGCRQPEKLNVLRNAVLNAALPGAPEERAQVIYLKVVDILTPWHFRLLRDFSQVALVDAALIDSQLPSIAKQRRFYDNLVNDLEGLGLILFPHRAPTSHIERERPVITDQGRRLLRYISSPLAC